MTTPAITSTPEWAALLEHGAVMGDARIAELFTNDPDRFASLTFHVGDLLVDCSKHLATCETLEALLAVAAAADVLGQRDAMFAGERINTSEHRAVGHVALRRAGDEPFMVGDKDVMPSVHATLQAMAAFTNQVHEGVRRGATGEVFTDVVNIGIGGSDLGPRMVTAALAHWHTNSLRSHFVANVDPANLHDVLDGLNPATTLLIVASKSFCTLETLTNARAARAWLTAALGEAAVADHFVAVSANAERVAQFGINPTNMFAFGDWVGGRYSVWSAIGLSVMLAVGPDYFRALLDGAHEMDEHFHTAPPEGNVPLLLGMLDVWYRNVHELQSQAVLPYDDHLQLLPAYLQQAMMESNGKQVRRDGQQVGEDTSPVLWGAAGTNGQHTFHQMLHQGTTPVPCDFLVAMQGHTPDAAQHLDLVANCIAQAEALMMGRTEAQVREALAEDGLDEAAIDALAPHKVMPGNRPTTMFLYPQLTPHMLGMLLACWEHRIFTAAAVWGINAFDQWGVELGKMLATSIRPMLAGDALPDARDASTLGLIAHVLKHR